ncbi:helix-turn-helix transcriptional regulator [Streptomyces pseudovenezuelae]|uniref:helix-turn-helix transcriptional regulator n=1 Tax=Streptomyces pseudovenezuelae TaxID=67350 RepID=UPI00371687EA
MPVRRFDPQRLLLARREASHKQIDVARVVGVSGARVSAWETGRAVPDPEKLPALAKAVDHDLDDLFPREGRPDLADLRTDAGYSQAATKELTGTKTAGPVAAAENGQRRLAEEYEEALAEAYGVSVAALRRAQERSFGNDVSEPDEPDPASLRGEEEGALPTSLADKIDYLLEQMPGPVSDAEISAAGNARTGRNTLTEDLVHGLRTGAVTSVSDEVLNALAEALDTTPLIFSEDADVQRIIAETLLLKGQIAAIAARGGDKDGLSAELLMFISKEVGKARTEARARGDHSSP